jgi:hypothetical protein
VLVLDDYHVIDARDVQDGMGFLLDHLPPHIHLVIASRADPPLPLIGCAAVASWPRSAPPICVSRPGEATAYLNEVMGLALTAADIPTSAAAEIQSTLTTRCYSQHSPFARSSSPGYSASLASRAAMIRPVSSLVRR